MKLFSSIIFSILFLIIYQVNAICDDYANTEWKAIGTNCGKFCGDQGQEIYCPPWQYHLGCFCKEGFFRDKHLQCVEPDKCYSNKPILRALPSKYIECPANEIYDNCSSRCLEMCKNKDDPLACPIKCDEGCFCRGARLRNDLGVCVPMEDCITTTRDDESRTCPDGEEVKDCAYRCLETCPNVMNTLARNLNCTKCEKGCFCRNGQLRNEVGTCVEKKACDKNKFIKIISSIFNVMIPKRFRKEE